MAISFKSSTSIGAGFYKNQGGITGSIDSSALMQVLKTLPQNIQKNVMVGAIRASANVIRDGARHMVPKDSRNLEKSIVSIQRKALNGEIIFSVTPSKGDKYDGWYAHMVEFGTVKQAAQPFLRPAFENMQDMALHEAKVYIQKRIPEEVFKAKR